MEGTALSLAKLTLETVLPVAKQAVANEALLLLGVRQEVSFIANELDMMQAFLRAAGAGDRARNEVVKIWVKQVRDLAYDVEDCIQEYLALGIGGSGGHDVQAETSRASSSAPGRWIRACLVPAGRLRDQHRMAVRIREVKASVEEVSKRNLRYSIVVQPGPIGPIAKDYMVVPATFAADVGAAEEFVMAGRAKVRDDLLGHLTAPHSEAAALQVAAVWGMGGMGKSVLVRDVLWSSAVGRVFNCRAWVTVPHPFDQAEVLRSLVGQLDMEAGCTASANRIRARTAYGEVPQLTNEVTRHLGDKRYIVVIDDVKSVAAEWDHIKQVLPDKNKGSWIIVTTRYEDIAKHCSTKKPIQVLYQLGHLSDEDSLHLLCKKAQINGQLSKELFDEASRIVKRCCGLPLAIAAVGGLLATKPTTPVEWRKLHDDLGSELKSNQGLEDFKNVLTSSYDGLPYHLKSCFLYLSIFPKYGEIRRARMVWRWMAEGLVTESREKAPEEVGESLFVELISRSMIQSSAKWVTNLNQRLRICQIHDMMQEIILEKSMEENQLFVLDDHTTALPREKVRHLVVRGTCRGQENILGSINMSHIRSLTVAGEQCPPQLIVPSKMRMLRVLDLEDCPGSKDADLAHIGGLRHLKYLGFRKTSISKLPESLGKLKFLQTLDMRDTNVNAVPQGVTKLEKLRHLLAGNSMRTDDENTQPPVSSPRRTLRTLASTSFWRPDGGGSTFVAKGQYCNIGMRSCNGVRLPNGMGNLRSLRILGKIDVSHNGQRVMKDIRELTALRALVVAGLTEKDGPEFGDMICELRSLQHLQVCSNSKDGNRESLSTLGWLERTPPPPHLLTLRLYGHLGKLPGWVASLKDIIKIKLLATQLAQADAIEVLGDLPSLAALHLWRKSYVGERLHLGANKFRKLKLMHIDSLEDLVSLEIEETAMPLLEFLLVYKCCALRDDEDGFTGVPFLASLKELRLKYVGDKRRLEAVLQRQVREHHNNPLFITSSSHAVGQPNN